MVTFLKEPSDNLTNSMHQAAMNISMSKGSLSALKEVNQNPEWVRKKVIVILDELIDYWELLAEVKGWGPVSIDFLRDSNRNFHVTSDNYIFYTDATHKKTPHRVSYYEGYPHNRKYSTSPITRNKWKELVKAITLGDFHFGKSKDKFDISSVRTILFDLKQALHMCPKDMEPLVKEYLEDHLSNLFK